MGVPVKQGDVVSREGVYVHVCAVAGDLELELKGVKKPKKGGKVTVRVLLA